MSCIWPSDVQTFRRRGGGGRCVISSQLLRIPMVVLRLLLKSNTVCAVDSDFGDS